MEEPRKIVLILGNGFDLDLGLKTSYKDFWESEFCPKDYPAPLIQHLNQRWPDGLDAVKWYDLENELFNYYKEIRQSRRIPDVITPEERRFINEINPAFLSFGVEEKYYDAANSLLQKGILKENPQRFPLYLMPYRDDLIQPSLWRDRKALSLIKEGLCNYLLSLRQPSESRFSLALNVLFAVNCAREEGAQVSIYTFNYTKLPEDYGNGFRDVVHHVHGSCDKRNIIVGTKDDEEFDDNYDFLQKALDPFFNPPALVADLLEAEDVIFYGHSIGENDRQYFKAFFKRQTDYTHPSRKDISIFTLDDRSEVEIKRALQKMTDSNLSTLYGLNNLCIIKASNIRSQPAVFRRFLSRYIQDERQVRVTMSQIMENQ